MPGPISTNAPFTEFGNSMILRDIEQLYMLVGQSTGDLGNKTIQSNDTSGNGANKNNTSSNASSKPTVATKVAYLGTLDLPIFGQSNTIAGNAAGQYAVDWQQYRGASTQVASGNYSVISGGFNNTASGQSSAVIGGSNCAAVGVSSVASGSNSSSIGNYSVALGSVCVANANSSIAMGSSVSSYGVGLGRSVTNGIDAIALGYSATVPDNSIGIGKSLNVTGTTGITLLTNSAAVPSNFSGNNSIAIIALGTSFSGTLSLASDKSITISAGVTNNLNGTPTGIGTTSLNALSTSVLTADGSFFVGLNQATITPATLVRGCAIFGQPSISAFGSGLIQNTFILGSDSTVFTGASSTGNISSSVSMCGGSLLISSTATGSISTTSAIAGSVTVSGSGGSISNSVAIGGNFRNNSGTAVNNILAAGWRGGSYYFDANGHSQCLFLGYDVTYLGTYSVLVDNCTFIGYGLFPSFIVPAAKSTTILGELGSTGKFGCNDTQPQAKFPSGGAVVQSAGATYTTTEQAMLGALKILCNNLRSALVTNGIMS